MPPTDVAHPSTAAIAGHPLHPALVPLPIGAAALAFATDLLGARTADPFWARCSRWLLRASFTTGLLAAPLGSIDLLTIPAARRLPSAWVHGAGNGVVLLLTLAEIVRRGARTARADEVAPDRTGLTLALLGITGWLGGELSYRHRIGVMHAAASGEPLGEWSAGEGTRAASGSVAILVVEDAGGGGLGWVGGAVEDADRTHPAGIDEGVMPSEEAVERAREAAVPHDGPTPGAAVSADPTGPGGLVATGVHGGVGAHAATAGQMAGPALDPGTADAIARELARSEEPAEGRTDVLDDDRPWGAGRTL